MWSTGKQWIMIFLLLSVEQFGNLKILETLFDRLPDVGQREGERSRIFRNESQQDRSGKSSSEIYGHQIIIFYFMRLTSQLQQGIFSPSPKRILPVQEPQNRVQVKKKKSPCKEYEFALEKEDLRTIFSNPILHDKHLMSWLWNLSSKRCA